MIKVLLVCLTTCFMLANTADFAATVSCMKCSINCQFNKCVRITTDGYDNQFCGTSECNLNKSYPELFFKCDYDVSGKKCSTGVCFQPPAHGCADTTSCTNSYYLNTACETCTSIAGCTQCLVTRTNSTGIQLGSESCLGNSCNDVQTVNRNIGPCTNKLDPFGNPCTCCYNVTAVVDKRVGVCTASYALYSGAGFNTYAQSRTSESSLIVSLLLVFSIIAIMLAY